MQRAQVAMQNPCQPVSFCGLVQFDQSLLESIIDRFANELFLGLKWL
jgi:hypothetical protein